MSFFEVISLRVVAISGIFKYVGLYPHPLKSKDMCQYIIKNKNSNILDYYWKICYNLRL